MLSGVRGSMLSAACLHSHSEVRGERETGPPRLLSQRAVAARPVSPPLERLAVE